MNGTASRYIGGVPYDPSRSVGRYPTRASILSGPTVSDAGGVTPVNFPLTDGSGIAFNPANGTVSDAGVNGGGGGNALLLSALLGALSYAPDAYNAIRDLFAGDEPARPQTASDQPIPVDVGGFGPNMTALMGRGGFSGTDAAMAQALDQAGITSGPATSWIGEGGNWTGAFEPGTLRVDQAATQRLLDAPMGSLGQEGALGPGSFETPMVSTADAGGVTVGSTPADAGFNWANPLGVRTGLEDTLGTLGGVDVASSLASAGAGIAGAYATRGLAGRSPENQMGSTIGSTLGGLVGGWLLGPAGAFAGAAGGGAIGGQIGAQPTIGRNFGIAGTFNPDGSINWGQGGGDNGGTGDDAIGAANWLTPTLNSLAQQYGYAFNPAAAGGQIRIGGYDNFDRNQTGTGGMFYDVQGPGGVFGGSPERYTLRPAQSTWGSYGGWDGGSAFTDQGYNAYANNVLADLVARGVYTAGGQNTQAPFWGGQDVYGFYNSQDPFQTTLANRQAQIGGAIGQEQRAAELNNREGTALTWDQLQGEFQYLPQFNQYQFSGGGPLISGDPSGFTWQGGMPVANAPAADPGAPVEYNTWQNN